MSCINIMAYYIYHILNLNICILFIFINIYILYMPIILCFINIIKL